MQGAEWVLCAAFLMFGAFLLPTLDYNYDEGVYIQQALQIIGGNLPYRDFFCHQTPLYPLTLAAFAAPVPDSLFVFRLMSLLATALSGVLVYRIAVRVGVFRDHDGVGDRLETTVWPMNDMMR